MAFERLKAQRRFSQADIDAAAALLEVRKSAAQRGGAAYVPGVKKALVRQGLTPQEAERALEQLVKGHDIKMIKGQPYAQQLRPNPSPKMTDGELKALERASRQIVKEDKTGTLRKLSNASLLLMMGGLPFWLVWRAGKALFRTRWPWPEFPVKPPSPELLKAIPAMGVAFNPSRSNPNKAFRGGEYYQEIARRRRAPVGKLKAAAVTYAARWQWLRQGGQWNPDLRKAASGSSGVYAIRDKATKEVLYVGESHTRRLWKTLIRHFQGRDSFSSVDEWTHGAPERLEVALWTSPDELAFPLEQQKIRKFTPRDQRQLFEIQSELAEEIPF